jgi:hypothetical protein
MRITTSTVAALLLMSLLCGRTSSSDNGAELTGHWSARIPMTPIHTGAFRYLDIRKSKSKHYLTVVRGNRQSLGANEEAHHIMQTTTTEVGPYILSQDGDRLVYRDEKGRTNDLPIVQEETHTILNDGSYKYDWFPEQP